LLQAEKLSAIGQLVAGVAHELNNPLTSVIGYAQLVEEELRTTSPDDPPRAAADVAQDVRRIAEESERAARIVRNLLAFARRQTAARTPQDLAELASRVLSLRAYEFRLSGVEVETAFETNLPRVSVDAGQLQQALLNLVLNAEQAMRGRTPRRLRVAARHLADAAAVEVLISDNGHGINDENIRRIFDPFFTTRDVGEGTGLGLSICYGIVRDHGGQITVSSRPGEGTTFSLVLPAERAASLPVESVVVAHADQSERDYIAAALTAWGFKVETIDQASATLARLGRGPLDVAFVDRAFATANPAAWQAARAGAPSTAVVLLGTADAHDASFEDGKEADAVLAPPFELRALRAALRGVCRECV
jgi:two-component system NtrC family sensor kinase